MSQDNYFGKPGQDIRENFSMVQVVWEHCNNIHSLVDFKIFWINFYQKSCCYSLFCLRIMHLPIIFSTIQDSSLNSEIKTRNSIVHCLWLLH